MVNVGVKINFNYGIEKNFIIIVYFLLYSNNKNKYIEYLLNYSDVFIKIKHHYNLIKFVSGETLILNKQENHLFFKILNLNISNEIKDESFVYFFKEYKNLI